jgi:hypothetical protein
MVHAHRGPFVTTFVLYCMPIACRLPVRVLSLSYAPALAQ